MRPRSRLALAGLLLVGTSGSAAVLDEALTPPRETRVAIQRPPQVPQAPRTRQPGELCNGGLDPLATIEIVPDVAVNIAGREHVEYHSEISLQRGQKVGVAWSADVVDDRGNVVVAKLDTGTFKGHAGHVAFTNALKTPLNDGFYALRVRAAVTDADEGADIVEAVQHVEVAGGRWAELSDREWFERSQANQVFTTAELATRGLP
jgi:hypothetical protein